VALSADEAGRFAVLFDEHEGDLVDAWAERVATMLRGRLSQGELRRQISELRRGFQQALADGATEVTDQSADELRAQLSELSTNRARQGFSATETAVSIFALKDAVLGVLDKADGGDILRDYVAFSSFVDGAALFTFDSYVRVREGLIADQAEQLLELSTPVVKLWEGVVAVPLVGTLDSARAQVVMERLLQTTPVRRTRSSTSPACRPWTPRSRSTSSRPWWPPG
jgi:rsbT co-antagonist protein RsbR